MEYVDVFTGELKGTEQIQNVCMLPLASSRAIVEMSAVELMQKFHIE